MRANLGSEVRSPFRKQYSRDTAMPCPARGLGHGIAVSLRFDFNNWYNIEDCSKTFLNLYYSETGAVLRVPARDRPKICSDDPTED
ncbi:hypothetical protein QUB68_00595 [Microcoleus sp. A006_D1]|uniref:hypothetical protein n=1 Tax=Microcoleus sp. A006_D1 TaxID=3055267 RepID=UPI002FD269E5